MRRPFHAQCRFASLVLLALLLLPGAAGALNLQPSQPVKAVFYPDEVEVSVEEVRRAETVPGLGTGLLIPLPSGVVPGSVQMMLDGKIAGGWSRLTTEQALMIGAPAGNRALLPEDESNPARRALLEKVGVLAAELGRLEGEVASLEARIALWGKTLEKFGTPAAGASAENSPVLPSEEAVRLSQLYATQYPQLYSERLVQSNKRDAVRAAHGVAVQALHAYDRKDAPEFLFLPLPAAVAGKLRYSYVLPGRCSLGYRLTAYPDKGEIGVAEDASVLQNSGFTWEAVEVLLSTVRRDKTVRPANVRPWKVALEEKQLEPQPPAPVASAAMAEEKGAYRARQRIADGVDVKVKGEWQFAFGDLDWGGGTAEDQSVFRLWNLGKRRVEHGTSVHLPLAESAYPAKFFYTIRPYGSPKGFLTAELDLPAALDLPVGTAQFAVDDALLGRESFSFSGKKGRIYFGTDPQVKAEMRDLKLAEGRQGVFSKEQTLLWHWEITVTNNRAKPVEVLVEDAAPQLGDEAFSLAVTSSPKAEEVVNAAEDGGAGIFRWVLDVQPGTAEVINHKVQIKTPVDKERVIVPGRRI